MQQSHFEFVIIHNINYFFKGIYSYINLFFIGIFRQVGTGYEDFVIPNS
jgi:hypothetical protein